MSGALEAAGATREPSEYATLSMDRAITGLWTQRSPLRDADVPYLYGKFYSASRFDSLIDGINREVNARLTNARRAGTSPYNANTFPAGNSFYPFKYVQNGAEVVRVLYDGKDGKIYDATAGQKATLFTKSPGANKARFLGVGTELFFSDGMDTMKWLRSSLAWTPATPFNINSFIVDSGSNLQLAVGNQVATIAALQITGNVVTLFLSSSTPLTIPVGTRLTPSGMTTLPALNGTTQTVTVVANSQQIKFSYAHADLAYSAETGTATTGNGVTGGSAPAWATTIGAITQDGGLQWVCRGSSIQNWMFPAPTNAPTVTQVAAPSLYPGWAAGTWYGPSFVIVDSNGNLQQLTTGGTTGTAAPTWAVTAGTTTTDGSAVWTCKGAATWQALRGYIVGDLVQATFTYYITIPEYIYEWNGSANVPVVTYTQQPITVTSTFRCVSAGTSGASAPAWTNGTGTNVSDGSVGWQNIGTASTWPGAAQAVSTATQIIDPSGNVQIPQIIGKTGAAAPTFASAQGSFTADNAQNWLNNGIYGKANTGAWQWSYSGRNSITKDVSTASPLSTPLTVSAGQQPVLQGFGLADPQIDTLVIWRTPQAGSQLLYVDTIPNPGAAQTWIYTDTTPDNGLNSLMLAPINNANDPPPANITAMAYHCGRIFAISGINVIWSAGPDVVNVGSGNTAFPPLNFAQLPEQPVRLFACVTNQGPTMLVFCTTNVYAIFGAGTQSSPFQRPAVFMTGVGIVGYDAITSVGSTYYALTTKNKFVSLDPGAGYVEQGFPIGDQLLNVTTGADSAPGGALYDPSSAFVSWHEQNSGDTGIYLADGSVGWFRFSPVASPESGFLWSPRAAILAGTSAVQSIETTPGQSQLLIAPGAGGGPILFRNSSVSSDWSGGRYQPFPSWDVKGNIVLCQSGEVAEIAHIALKSKAVGGRPKVSLLLGEIAATVNAPFDELAITSTDPPELPPSVTIFSDRYSALQNGVTPKCDHFQLKVDYGVQDAADELLMFSVYGAKHAERRNQ